MKVKKISDAKCTALAFSAPVTLSKDDDDITGFLIEAYTGETVERWWGMLAIEVEGISARASIPVLMNHDPDYIVGYSTRSYKDGSFFVSGKFSDVTEKAREVKGLAMEGFPWQASIGVVPIKILSLEVGGEMQVNGRTVKGPAEIWLESEVVETSFVPLGADGNTSVSTFARITEEQAPEKQSTNKEESLMKITMEDLKEKAPDLLASIKADAVAAHGQKLETAKKEGADGERTRIQAVLSQQLPGHSDLIQQLAFDGVTTGPEAAVQVLAAEKGRLSKTREDLASDGIKPVTPSTPADPAPADSDEAADEAAFNANAALKKEFGDFEAFQAYKTATDQGQVKIISKGRDK